ncbi:glycosyltransferase family 4 protein [Elusimicrobiota bacterium]
MKILQIEIAGKGGICHYTYSLAEKLAEHASIALITGRDYELDDKVDNFEVIKIFNRYKTSPLSLLKIRKLFRDKTVNAVHFQLSQHPYFVMLLAGIAKRAGKKIIITAHNVVSHEEKNWETTIFRKIYKLADRIIVHAQANKAELGNMFDIETAKIAVIPHGNYAFFGEGNMEPAPVGDTFNILFFGYIRKYKGLTGLIRAVKLVKERIPQVKLYIVGRPVGDFGEYRKEIENCGLTENVELNLEYVPFEDVKNYFDLANVVVMPYIKIYQSGILQLAYGLGRPVIVTDVGGMAEVVEDGRTGFIVPPGDDNALAGKLSVILEDTDLQKKMGKCAFELARTRYSWDSIALKTMKMYREIV